MNPDLLLAHFNAISDAPDAVPRLRSFVRDLAVRGKLVQQEPEDEPASELLKRIRAEKARLAATGDMRRQQELSRVSDAEVPFLIPENWKWVRLIDLLIKLTDGTHHSPPNSAQGDFKYITAKNIKPEGVSLENLTYISKSVHDEIYGRCNPERGDILYIKDGATTGVVTINNLDEPFSLLSSVALLKASRAISNRLLVEFLRSPFFYMQMRGFMKGAAITRVTLKRMAPALVPLPPIAEQHRIVAKLNELMTLCDRLEAAQTDRENKRDRLAAASHHHLNGGSKPEVFRKHANFYLGHLPRLTTRTQHIKELRRTILSLAGCGRLVPQDPDDEPASELLRRIQAEKNKRGRVEKSRRQIDPSKDDQNFLLPTGWVRTSLADLVSVLNGRAYSQNELLNEGTPVLRVGNLFTSQHWYYSNLELPEDKYCDEGDLIFAWSASFGPFIWRGPRVIYHYHIWKLALHSERDLDKQYLYHLLLQKTQAIKESGHGVSMLHMTKERMEKLQVPLPPLAEQRRIAAKVNELMSLCDRLELQLTNAQVENYHLLDAVLRQSLAAEAAARSRKLI